MNTESLKSTPLQELPHKNFEEALIAQHDDPFPKYRGGTKITAIPKDTLKEIFGFIETESLQKRLVNKQFAEAGEECRLARVLKLRKLVNSYLGKEAPPKVTARWQIQKDSSLRWQHFAFYNSWDCFALKKTAILLFTGSSLARVYDIMRSELQGVKLNIYSEGAAKELMKLKRQVRRQAKNYHKRHWSLYKALVKLLTKQDLDVSLTALVAEIDVKISLALKKSIVPSEICSQNFMQLEKALPQILEKDTYSNDLWINPETGKFLAVRLSSSHQAPTILDNFSEGEDLGKPNAVIVQGNAGKYRNYRISIFNDLALAQMAKQTMALTESELKNRDNELKSQFPHARKHLQGFVYPVRDPLSPKKTHQISSQDGKILYAQERMSAI